MDNIGCPGQAKRHPGYAKQKHNIHALKGQKRKNIKALGMRNKSTIFTLLPFQGVNGFTNDNPPQGAASLALGYALHWAFSPPRVPLRLPWASYVIHQILDDFFVLIYVTVTQHKPKESTHNSHQIFSRLAPLQPKFSTACFWCY